MKLLLSEHNTRRISLATEITKEKPFGFTEELFNKIDCRAINVFKKDRGRDLFPFHLRKNDQFYDISANYYVGVDWLIVGKKFVQVEPKVNSAIIKAFAKQTDALEVENTNCDDIDKNTKNEVLLEENLIEIDYLRILLELSSNPTNANNISDILKIDWNAEQIPVEQKDDRLTPFLVVQFLQILKAIVRKGLKKSYYKVQENLTNRVKGKILVGQHIKQNVFKNRLTKTYCEYQEFGFNHLENQFLKKVFGFAVNYVQNDKVFFTHCEIGTKSNSTFKDELLDIINYCRPAFEHISGNIKEQELKNIKHNPFFKEYKDAIKIGGYILKKFSYNISNTVEKKNTTPPFWIDMPILFELYFYNQLLKSNPQSTKNIHYQYSTYGNSLDILISKPGFEMVIDTKYKLQYQSREVHEDIRQVSGYARLNKVRKELGFENEEHKIIDCLIVYPDLYAPKDQDYTLQYVKENRQELSAYHKVYKLGISLPFIQQNHLQS